MTVRWIIDPGHGWLEVPLDEYPDAVECGSGYGYIDPVEGKIYLEEDMEAGLFIIRHGEHVVKGVRQQYLNDDWMGRYTLEHNESRVTYDEYIRELKAYRRVTN